MSAPGSRARIPSPRGRTALRGVDVDTIQARAETAERCEAVLLSVLNEIAAAGIDVDVGYGPKLVSRIKLAATRLHDIGVFCRRQLAELDGGEDA